MKNNLAEKINNRRNNWKLQEVLDLFNMPFSDLMFEAQTVHRKNFNPNAVQLSTLLSIKTGGCAEDCKYCPQSSHYKTDIKADKLMNVEDVVAQAQAAKNNGASRFCMGAAWREMKDRDMPKVTEMIKGVKDLGLETCMTLGMLSDKQADELATAGLDYYNHNIDTSREYYDKIITTRTFEDRIDTLNKVRNTGMKVCCGGIMGMGESVNDRASMLLELANMDTPPESVPINYLVQVEGTPLKGVEKPHITEFVKMIAVARIMLPESYVRLSAGRETMSDETQALCFLAGANSIFYGEKLLTTPNPIKNRDMELFDRLGIQPLN